MRFKEARSILVKEYVKKSSSLQANVSGLKKIVREGKKFVRQSTTQISRADFVCWNGPHRFILVWISVVHGIRLLWNMRKCIMVLEKYRHCLLWNDPIGGANISRPGMWSTPCTERITPRVYAKMSTIYRQHSAQRLISFQIMEKEEVAERYYVSCSTWAWLRSGEET